MRRPSKRPRARIRFDRLEGRDLLSGAAIGPAAPASTPPVLVAVLGTGIDLNPADPVHYTGSTGLLDLNDAFDAVAGTYGVGAVIDLAPSKSGTRAASNAAAGITFSIQSGGPGNVQIVPIRTSDPNLGTTPPYAVLNGIYHAVELGAGVIDLTSVGTSLDLTAGQIQELTDALQYARSRGVVVVAPAGNGYAGTSPVGVDLDRAGAGYNAYPAGVHLANMLVVTTIDALGNPSWGANWGATHVDLGAPSVTGDGDTSSAGGFVAGVAGVVAASRPDWGGIDAVNRIKQTARPSPGLAGKSTTGGVVNPALALQGIAGVSAKVVPGDFEGDGRSDFAIYGSVPGAGYLVGELSSTQGFDVAKPVGINNRGASLGGPGAIPVPGHYFYGAASVPAVYASQPGTGRYDFTILAQDPTGAYYAVKTVAGVGGPGDIPIAADFTGSGRDDLGLYGLHDGVFGYKILTAASGFDPARAIYVTNNGSNLGGPGDSPVAGDFFGDGVASPGFYGPEYGPDGKLTGRYAFGVLDSGSINAQFKYTRAFYLPGFGGPGDIPIAGDFDGDHRTDLGLYGKFGATYGLAILASSNGFNPYQFLFVNNNGASLGGPGSTPIAGDFFGNGQQDAAVYGPEIGADGRPTGAYTFTALDPGSFNAKFQFTRSITARNFGSPGAIPANAPAGYRYFKAIFG